MKYIGNFLFHLKTKILNVTENNINLIIEENTENKGCKFITESKTILIYKIVEILKLLKLYHFIGSAMELFPIPKAPVQSQMFDFQVVKSFYER